MEPLPSSWRTGVLPAISRKKTTQVDGEIQTGWFASDFTLAEIKTLGAIATDSERPQQYNGL